jgi:hypothetical protein
MNIMGRNGQLDFSVQEDQAWSAFCSKHNVIPEDQGNLALIAHNAHTLDAIVTVEWLEQYLQHFLALGLKTKSEARIEWERVAASTPSSVVQEFGNWFDNVQSILVKDGDDGYRNASTLLTELRGRPINPETIHQALGRISYNANRRQLVYVPQAKKVDPRQQPVDPNHKHGQFITDANIPEWKRRRALREQQAQANPSAADSQKIVESAAQTRAEGRRGNTHSQTEQIQRIFVMKQGSNDIDWASTDEARDRMQQSFSNRSIR